VVFSATKATEWAAKGEHVILARVETDNSIDRWERCCDVFEHTYRQNKEVAMAGYGRLWKIKPAAYAPPKRNGVFAEMDRLRNENN
jgi:hypothetical protein